MTRFTKKSTYPLWRKVSQLAGLSLASVALLLSGCESTESGTSGAAQASRSAPKGKVELEKGMSKTEVVAMLGEPATTQEVVENNITAEIWTYSREVVVSSTIESDGEQERVYADPETGQFVTVREPIYRNESVKAKVTLELLFNGDELVAFKEKVVDGVLDVGH